MLRILPILLATLLAAPARAQSPSDPIKVPFELLPSGHFLVDVTLNGKGPFKLVFDTGAPLLMLNSHIAKVGGVSKKGGGFSFFTGPQQVDIKELGVGKAKAENVPSVIMDHPTVEAISDAFEKKFGKIEGIVGFPFFSRYATTIDYQKRELTLVPNGYVPGDFLQDMMTSILKATSQASNPEPKIVAPAGLWGFRATKAKSDKDAGIVVKSVADNGPAAAGGLKAGDRLLTLDGRWTDSETDLANAAKFVKPGRKAKVVVMRDGKEVELTVTPQNGY
ncbi:MAG TPA: PDZ domain-containing protein [Fimbriiglobus sp.]